MFNIRKNKKQKENDDIVKHALVRFFDKDIIYQPLSPLMEDVKTDISDTKAVITIYTKQPSKFIGREGETVKVIAKEMSNILLRTAFVDIQEYKS